MLFELFFRIANKQQKIGSLFFFFFFFFFFFEKCFQLKIFSSIKYIILKTKEAFSIEFDIMFHLLILLRRLFFRYYVPFVNTFKKAIFLKKKKKNCFDVT
jgi:hypothetical protein